MNPTPSTAPDTRPWYRYRSPWLLMLGPAAVVVAGVATAWLAISTEDGLVVEDYYKEGKAINRVLKREETAGAMGRPGIRPVRGGCWPCPVIALLSAGLISIWANAGCMPIARQAASTHGARAGAHRGMSGQRRIVPIKCDVYTACDLSRAV